MEIIIEAILELLFDSAVEVAIDKNKNRALRITLGICVLLIPISIFAVLGIAGVALIISSDRTKMLAGITILVIDLALILAFIIKVIKVNKRMKEDKEKIEEIKGE